MTAFWVRRPPLLCVRSWSRPVPLFVRSHMTAYSCTRVVRHLLHSSSLVLVRFRFTFESNGHTVYIMVCCVRRGECARCAREAALQHDPCTLADKRSMCARWQNVSIFRAAECLICINEDTIFPFGLNRPASFNLHSVLYIYIYTYIHTYIHTYIQSRKFNFRDL